MIILSLATIESVNVPIDCDHDVTSDAVGAQLVPTNTAAPVSFVSASWLAGKTNIAVTPTMGAAGAQIRVTKAGVYDLYVQVVDNPEVPVLLCGQVGFR